MKQTQTDIKVEADHLGERYVAVKGKIAELAGQLTLVTDEIKAKARESGELRGKRRTLRGHAWEVGFLQKERTRLDEVRLRKLIGPKLFAGITVQTLKVDEDKLKQAVADGQIKSALLQSCLITEPLSDSIYVRPVTANQDEAQES